jgi:hypothetical protein
MSSGEERENIPGIFLKFLIWTLSGIPESLIKKRLAGSYGTDDERPGLSGNETNPAFHRPEIREPASGK